MVEIAFHDEQIVAIDNVFPVSLGRRLIEYYQDSWENMSIHAQYDALFLFSSGVVKGDNRRKQLNSEIPQHFIKALEVYSSIYSDMTVTRNVECKLIRYLEGYSAEKHWDFFEGRDLPDPKISCTIILNEFEGGELCFHVDDNVIEVPSKPGRMVLFPSKKRYTHEVKQVRRGVRYSLVAWFL